MSYTVSLQKRIQQLKKIKADVPKALYKASKEGTLRAIEAAQDATPPKAGTGRGSYIGANTITGALKASWASASKLEPEQRGASFVTELNNDMEYASYVDKGHRMDRHFVPGLYINPYSGLLEYQPGAKGVGIVVGTKTKYVKGEFMTDKAIEAFENTTLDVLDKEIERLMK